MEFYVKVLKCLSTCVECGYPFIAYMIVIRCCFYGNTKLNPFYVFLFILTQCA